VTERSWIARALGDPAAFERLASGLPGTTLWSVLMEVARERARARTPAQVLAQYRRDRFVRPSPIDLRVAAQVDAQLLAAAGAFEALELSPVAPLGTCTAVAPTDQHRILSALRGTEVVSDPTNVLALECADRLARAPDATVRLTTIQRVIRAQQVPDVPGFAQHFRIFVLVTAGREQRDHATVVGAMAEQIRVMLRALDALERHGYAFGARRVDVKATPERAALGDRLAEALGADLPAARSVLEHPYYSGGARAMIWVTAPDGREVPLCDTGAFDWIATLTANQRHVYAASGMGAQLVPFLFKRDAGAGAAPGAGAG
jgi:hypothetical protein